MIIYNCGKMLKNIIFAIMSEPSIQKKGKTYVLGDIHGGYLALVQVLNLAGFDYENDTLITLGDYCAREETKNNKEGRRVRR